MPAEPTATRGARRPRWIAGGVFALLVPKCVLCLAAYLGGGATLGWSTRELCGASPFADPLTIGGLVLAGAVAGLVAAWLGRRGCRVRTVNGCRASE